MTAHLRLFLVAGLLAAPALCRAQSISGTLFEDLNYGGGAGRSLTAANAALAGSAVPLATAATVELYDASGNFMAATTTSTAAGSLGQYSFTGLAAGTYQVRVVSSTVRSTRTGSVAGLVPVQTFVVRNGAADVNRVGGENPAQADGPANAASGGVTLRFQGLSSSGDNTAFIDQVEVLNSGGAVVNGAVLNNSFETPDLGNASGSLAYNATGAQWEFTGASGIAANGSAFNSTAPAGGGDQVAFMQNQGAPQQTLTLAPGTYTIRFQAIQRTTNNQSVQVLVNGTQVASVTPPQGSYITYTTASFTVGANLAALTPHSLAPVTVTGTTPVTGVDFGFNFDVITNVNDAGQGSLRQFILNANALDNTTLRQQGRARRRETSLFMIPDGQAHPGLRASLTDQLTGSAGQRVAQYSPASVLPTITGAGTVLDGTTQTSLVGNTNTVLLGTGGTVGTDDLPLSQVSGPEVELAVTLTAGSALTIAADSSTLRGLSVHGAATGVQASGNGLLLEGNALGITPTAVALPATARTSGMGLTLNAPTATVQNNLIGYAGISGLRYLGARTTTATIIRNNEFVQNGQVSAGGDAISIGDNGSAVGPLLIEGNLISLSNSSGIQLEIGRLSNNIIRNNTISGNGTGGTSTRLEGSGIHYLARNGTVNSTNTDLITRNLITRNQSSGIVLNYGQRNVQISQNSIFLNGDGTIAGAAGLLSIDFTGPNGRVGGDVNYGQGDGVTGNDGLLDVAGTPTSQIPPYRQANGGIDYPVITNISKDSNNRLRVQGYVGSAAGQTQFGGATVEIYSANNTDTNQNGPVVAGDGQSVAHGEAQYYVGTITAAADGTFDATLATVARNIQPGEVITATAYLAGYGTSECGVNQISSFRVLPVQLTQFTATAQGQQVQLRWATASELRNDRFELERATDGRNFRQIGQVAGHGTTSQGYTYRFLDTPPAAPLLYYRLRQVDVDGTATYSAVQTVRLNAPAAKVLLSPNPATSAVTVNLMTLPAGLYELTLRDVQGRTVLRRTANTDAPLTLPLQTLPGVYYLTVQGQQQLLTLRLLKQ
ncbi:T9SS type A sorting domain-containing protein [Hymenobacter aquaticus]|uniref:T9SS type A sorting domain-containing protein n=1 Tax=Hymenobacter aquaticus TaxID=1867101 RepID=A0A4Z0PTA3_9BACT|nr:T9SS type A sorting domain-containing protein [Hymenobacter aquaticus]TGE20539.1 T9SS type A sorting domain-containing protein [Hymenobacter aquaticus]